LADDFKVSVRTIAKWRCRTFTHDLSSRPHNIEYAVADWQAILLCAIRKISRLPIDDIHDMLERGAIPLSRSAIYRCLKRNNLSAIPQEQREKSKKFKEYRPGYLHIDVTYLPVFERQRAYLFVAIDRATRTLFYKIYPRKSAPNAADFLQRCVQFFPFVIEFILTDNGLEFTNKLRRSKNGKLWKKVSRFDKKCKKYKIVHRLTKPATPKTNGMVERANGIIKQATILRHIYAGKNEMVSDLCDFLVHYNLRRRHSGLHKELGVKTPYEALQKWYGLEPTIFSRAPQAIDLEKNMRAMFYDSS
jgi:transposase-like protein